jgi:hypothetical protein
MKERITALVVHQNSETLLSLKCALERQGMCIIHAETRAQAIRMLGGQKCTRKRRGATLRPPSCREYCGERAIVTRRGET